MTENGKQEALLKNYIVVEHKSGNKHLEGNVFGHLDKCRCPDGRWIHTSNIVWIDEKLGVAETNNTLYTLDSKHKGH